MVWCGVVEGEVEGEEERGREGGEVCVEGGGEEGGLWEARSRPGCQGPQRKCAGYLSTTSWKLKVSGNRNSLVIREMMRKEKK